MTNTINTKDMDNDQAIRYVLLVLRSPLALISPEREQALELARKYRITVEELLTFGRRAAKKA
jgi:hypothetical protein